MENNTEYPTTEKVTISVFESMQYKMHRSNNVLTVNLTHQQTPQTNGCLFQKYGRLNFMDHRTRDETIGEALQGS